MQKGPEIRTGLTKDGIDHPISVGAEILITTDDKYANACDASIMYVKTESWRGGVASVRYFAYQRP